MFSYLGVLISVILGLALTHLLRGLSKLVQTRDTVKPYWVHVTWTVNILLYVLALWWGMYAWNRLQTWTVELFFFLTVYSVVVFVLASLLYPAEFPGDMDFEQYYYKNHRWFFGLLTLGFLLDIPETLQKGAAHLREVPVQYAYFIAASLAISLTLAVTRNRHVHSILGVSWFAVMLVYMNFTSIERLVGQ